MNSKSIVIGVLGLQGAIEEHIAATKEVLKRLGQEGEVRWVRREIDIEGVDGLIIPGGESTVIGGLASLTGLLRRVKERASQGMPILGTCAGMIMLAKRTYDRVVGETDQPLLGLMDITVERNSFGRQRESFEAILKIPILGEEEFKGVFIRSPSVKAAGPEVKVLSTLDEVIVAAREGNVIGTAFHPELSGDPRFHEYFVELVNSTKQVTT